MSRPYPTRTTLFVGVLSLALLGVECPGFNEGFRVDNRSDRRLVVMKVTATGDELEAAASPRTSSIPGFAPCEGNPVIIREVDGEELFRYEPEEGCDETSTLVIPPTEPYVEPGD